MPYALSGLAPSGAFSSGAMPAFAFVAVAGTPRRTQILSASLSISDNLDDTPNTCAFTAHGFQPSEGQEVIIRLGSSANRSRLFAGHILQVARRQQHASLDTFYDVSAIDYAWLLTKRKVTERYLSESASTIARDLIATYALNFTYDHVQDDLDSLDEITFTNEDLPGALTRLAKRIGGYWYVDYLKDLHFFVGAESGLTNPEDLTSAHPTLQNYQLTTDLSQVVTRVLVEGNGSQALEFCAVGETIIPVEDTAYFNDQGGTVVAGPQRITYTGVIEGGTAGAFVGIGAQPSVAPTGDATGGSGIEVGVHLYAYTWVTGAGETVPSPTKSVTHGTITAPTAAPTFLGTHGAFSTAAYTIGHTYRWRYRYSAHEDDDDLSASTDPSAAYSWVATTGPAGAPWAAIPLISIPHSADPRVRWVHIYTDHVEGGLGYRLDLRFENEPDEGLWVSGGVNLEGDGATAEPSANPTVQQTALTGIAIGPTGTTSRKVYRTVAGGSQLKLVTTIANNTATTYTDSTADGSLGANAPTGDTSGLSATSGQINPGSTALRVTSPAQFASTGGWVSVNGLMIRYTAVSSTELTGIPASGLGAITAPLFYNATVMTVPQLTGIPASGDGSIEIALNKGDEINLLAIVDHEAAQAALATLIGGSDDGVIEDYIQDRRLSEDEATARGVAILALRSEAELALSYQVRDTRTAAGRTVTTDIGTAASFKLQQVTIAGFDLGRADTWPLYSVQASSSKFSFEDLLRLARKDQA
jgi:hypothetical protein